MSESIFDPIEPVLGEFHVVDSFGSSLAAIAFEPQGSFAHSTAQLERDGTRYGLAALFRGKLLIATGPKDKVEIGAYRIQGDRLSGIWVPPGAKGCDLAMCGREESIRGDNDSFHIQKAHAVDQMPYTGSLTLTYLDPPEVATRRVKFNWRLHDGDYASFGLAADDVLVSTFNFEPDTPFAIGLYEPSHGEWRGTIAHSDGTTSTEILRR